MVDDTITENSFYRDISVAALAVSIVGTALYSVRAYLNRKTEVHTGVLEPLNPLLTRNGEGFADKFALTALSIFGETPFFQNPLKKKVFAERVILCKEGLGSLSFFLSCLSFVCFVCILLCLCVLVESIMYSLCFNARLQHLIRV